MTDFPPRAIRLRRILPTSRNTAPHRLAGGPEVPIGSRGTLAIDPLSTLTLPFIVRAVDDDGLHLVFELDAATAAKFRPFPERLAARRAA